MLGDEYHRMPLVARLILGCKCRVMKSLPLNPLLVPPAIVCSAMILRFGAVLFVPLSYGLFIAIVLYPLCKSLEKKGMPRTFAITIGLSIVMILFGLLCWLLLLQLQAFVLDLPQLQSQLQPSLLSLEAWIEEHAGISVNDQKEWLNASARTMQLNMFNNLQLVFGETIDGLFVILIVPVFTALFLYNREIFAGFLRSVFPNAQHDLALIIRESIHTYHRFIRGMVIVYLLVGLLNGLGLFMLGIEHAFLFGMITAVMTIIPYFGILISAAVPVSVAWISTGNIWLPLAVIAVFALVQYLEANIIFPRVVGTQLSVNTWAILVAILAGGVIWGMAGMIMFIPAVGVVKIISDHHPGWQSINLLLSKRKLKVGAALSSPTIS